MNSILLAFGITFLIVFAISVYNKDSWGECVAAGLVVGAFASIFVFLILVIVSTEPRPHDFAKATIIEQTPLYSTYSGDEVDGDLFLLIGGADTESYVYYWTQREDGALIKNKKQFFGEVGVVIFEEDRTDGELLVLSIPCTDYSFFSWFLCFPKTEENV